MGILEEVGKVLSDDSGKSWGRRGGAAAEGPRGIRILMPMGINGHQDPDAHGHQDPDAHGHQNPDAHGHKIT